MTSKFEKITGLKGFTERDKKRLVLALKNTSRAIKDYPKNVVGGAKIVGGAIKRAANKIF